MRVRGGGSARRSAECRGAGWSGTGAANHRVRVVRRWLPEVILSVQSCDSADAAVAPSGPGDDTPPVPDGQRKRPFFAATNALSHSPRAHSMAGALVRWNLCRARWLIVRTKAVLTGIERLQFVVRVRGIIMMEDRSPGAPEPRRSDAPATLEACRVNPDGVGGRRPTAASAEPIDHYSPASGRRSDPMYASPLRLTRLG